MVGCSRWSTGSVTRVIREGVGTRSVRCCCELLTYARPGDTEHISEMFRLVRGNQHILCVLEVLHRDQLALRIHDGAFSAMDLTARHPRTGELLSTVKFMVQTLAAAGELQREPTYDGLRSAEARGNKGGRRPAVAADKAGTVRAAYLEGRSIASLARDHGVSRGAIRTAVADLLPGHTATAEDVPAPELPVTLDMPGKIADFLRSAVEASSEEVDLFSHGASPTPSPGRELATVEYASPPVPRPVPTPERSARCSRRSEPARPPKDRGPGRESRPGPRYAGEPVSSPPVLQRPLESASRRPGLLRVYRPARLSRARRIRTRAGRRPQAVRRGRRAPRR
jgi:transposase-like protein